MSCNPVAITIKPLGDPAGEARSWQDQAERKRQISHPHLQGIFYQPVVDHSIREKKVTWETDLS